MGGVRHGDRSIGRIDVVRSRIEAWKGEMLVPVQAIYFCIELCLSDQLVLHYQIYQRNLTRYAFL